MATRKKMTRKEMRRRRQRQKLIVKSVLLVLLLIILGVCVWIVFGNKKEKNTKDPKKDQVEQGDGKQDDEQDKEPSDKDEQDETVSREAVLAEADYLAKTYDYDGAIEKLKSIEGHEEDFEITAKIADIQIEKDSCVPVNMNEVTHIFYHSLVVDPERGFAGNDSTAAGFKQWMTTVDEFNAITQQMYDNGYVLVRMRDLVEQTTDENGKVTFKSADLRLPEGKKAFVMSMDDLSYYHSYDGRGIASKMIVGEDGKPTCEYIDANGQTLVGDYDYVPLLDKFIEEHPDASYKGAKGMIALTGYNGILGYRTDIAYKTKENLTQDQTDWLAKHPDFDWEKEREEATKVADALKAQGWEFASHTWGHIRIGDSSLEKIKTDTAKWQEYVAPLIGGTDTIIFAHGQDLSDWHDYSADNEKFNYLSSQGFHFYGNVDSTQYFLQIRENYVRQGRRNLDGYRLWNDVHGEKNRTQDLFDASTVLDKKRTDVPAL